MQVSYTNSKEHQNWRWQPCEHFVPKAYVLSVCDAVCKELRDAGKHCDYGAIRLVAEPRNVMVAVASDEADGQMKVAISNSETLAIASKQWWQENHKDVLWRFGSDGSIHMPNGLYLTATHEGYVGLHPPCAEPIAPLLDEAKDTSWIRDRYKNFDAGDCCTSNSKSIWEQVCPHPHVSRAVCRTSGSPICRLLTTSRWPPPHGRLSPLAPLSVPDTQRLRSTYVAVRR